jgi:hypothetical protein
MGYEERNAWVLGGVTIATAAYYVVTLLGTTPELPLEARDYRGAMLWSIGGAIVGGIVLAIVVNIVAGIVTGDTSTTSDLRDRQINRFGDHVGQSLVTVGATGALILLMLDMPSFWAAQAIYFGFVASGILGTIARIASYRFGFSPW